MKVFETADGEPVKFRIQRNLPELIQGPLIRKITANGGIVLSRLPINGYIVVDYSSEVGRELKKYETPSRHRVSVSFIGRCIKAGEMKRSKIFISEDGDALQIWLDGSVSKAYSDLIQDYGGEVVGTEAEASIIIADEENHKDRFSYLKLKYSHGYKWVEPPDWIDECIQEGACYHDLPIPKRMPGRPPGRAYTAVWFTGVEKKHLVDILWRRLPDVRSGGRSARSFYQDFCSDLQAENYPWAKRHSAEAWRSQYNRNKEYYDEEVKRKIQRDGQPPRYGRWLFSRFDRYEDEDAGVPRVRAGARSGARRRPAVPNERQFRDIQEQRDGGGDDDDDELEYSEQRQVNGKRRRLSPRAPTQRDQEMFDLDSTMEMADELPSVDELATQLHQRNSTAPTTQQTLVTSPQPARKGKENASMESTGQNVRPRASQVYSSQPFLVKPSEAVTSRMGMAGSSPQRFPNILSQFRDAPSSQIALPHIHARPSSSPVRQSTRAEQLPKVSPWPPSRPSRERNSVFVDDESIRAEEPPQGVWPPSRPSRDSNIPGDNKGTRDSVSERGVIANIDRAHLHHPNAHEVGKDQPLRRSRQTPDTMNTVSRAARLPPGTIYPPTRALARPHLKPPGKAETDLERDDLRADNILSSRLGRNPDTSHNGTHGGQHSEDEEEIEQMVDETSFPARQDSVARSGHVSFVERSGSVSIHDEELEVLADEETVDPTIWGSSQAATRRSRRPEIPQMASLTRGNEGLVPAYEFFSPLGKNRPRRTRLSAPPGST